MNKALMAVFTATLLITLTLYAGAQAPGAPPADMTAPSTLIMAATALDKVFYTLLALGLTLLVLLAMAWRPIQGVLVPRYDEFGQLVDRHMAHVRGQGKEGLAQAEALLALAMAVEGAARTLGILFVLGLMATFI